MLARHVATILRRAACARKLTQFQVAERSGLHPSTVGRLFRSETFHMDTAERIAKGLDLELHVEFTVELADPTPTEEP